MVSIEIIFFITQLAVVKKKKSFQLVAFPQAHVKIDCSSGEHLKMATNAHITKYCSVPVLGHVLAVLVKKQGMSLFLSTSAILQENLRAESRGNDGSVSLESEENESVDSLFFRSIWSC